MNKKRMRVNLEKLPDILPITRKILEHHIKQKHRYWKNYRKAITKPQTNEDLLFGYLCDLEETTLRIQGVIMGEKLKVDRKQPLETYINNWKGHVGRIINMLEDMGFDMKTPPT
jgi:hypothetical protein